MTTASSGTATQTAAPPLLVADIAEHPTAEGKVYCRAIKDLFSNRIVGYAIAERMTADLAVTARAQRRPPPTRRRRGGPRRPWRPVSSQVLPGRPLAAGLKGSMGRVASVGDNAAMESFWALLQKNVLNQQQWRTREELHYAIVLWIEHTYNRRRRQRRLGKLTPVEFELAFAPQTATTAA